MSSIESKEYNVKKILVVSLSNIGDVILTCPVIDSLIQRFPLCEISVIVGSKAVGLFEGNPYIKDVFIFDKKQSFGSMMCWAFNLRKNNFDMVVDLRNTILSLILMPRYSTSLKAHKADGHMHDKHLARLWSVVPDAKSHEDRKAIFINQEAQDIADKILSSQINLESKYCVVGVGAADQKKRWTEGGFVEVCNWIFEQYGFQSVFVGDQSDFLRAEKISKSLKNKGVNLCGEINLLEFAGTLKRSGFVLSNDSAVMHMASYFNIPTIGLFGPTNSIKYGPWAEKFEIVRSPNEDGHEIAKMSEITPKSVKESIRRIL